MSKSKINHDIKLRTEKNQSVFVKSRKVNFIPKSYRFSNDDLIEIQNIADRLNKESRSKITHTKVLQILIHFCKKVPNNKLFLTMKEMI